MAEGPVATVDLDAIRSNLAAVRGRIPASTGVLAAVKANAYGHGAIAVARVLTGAGVRWLGVATPTEALALRSAGVPGDILIFGPAYERLDELADAGVCLTLAGPEALDALARADLPRPARVHLKIDTGMVRLGPPPSEALELAIAAARTPGIELEGVWTHLARADEPDAAANREQLDRFGHARSMLARHGIHPRLVHAANSAAAVALPEAAFDLVRPGIALYGYHAGPSLDALGPDLKPAMTLSAPVTFVKRIAAGTPVSYGHTWTAPRDTTVATVRCGYADGYPRSLSNRGRARLGDALVPVVGRVCMDQLLLDVGDREVSVGDTVELFGPAGPTAGDLAAQVGTISYEILTSVSGRVERAYVGGDGA